MDEFGTNLGFLESLNTKQLDRQVQRGPAKNKTKLSAQASANDSDSDSPEATYERAPRQRLQDQPAAQEAGLPTKNLHGELVYAKTKSGKQTAPGTKVILPHMIGADHDHDVFQLLSHYFLVVGVHSCGRLHYKNDLSAFAIAVIY